MPASLLYEYPAATTEEVSLIAVPAHMPNPVSERKITIEDLLELRFFVREAGSGTRNLFESIMTQNDIKIRIAGVYNNAESIKKAVIAGLGASVISRRSVIRELAQGKLASFKIKDVTFKRNFSIVYHKSKYISPGLQAIIDICHQLDAILQAKNPVSEH